MMRNLVITVNANGSSDLTWLMNRCVAAVENAVGEAQDAKRLGDEVEVSWDIED
jgi:hypothetical protein